MPPPSRLYASLAIALLCLVWGSTWYGIRVCIYLEQQPPLTSAAVRFLIAALAMAAVTPVLRRHENAPPPKAWLWVTAGLTNFSGCYGILYVTERVVPSGPAAVLWGIFPLLMATSGMLFLGERLRPRQIVGTLLAFAGIVTVFGGNLGDLDSGNLGYSLLLLTSPIVSTIGTTLVKRFGSGSSSLLLNRNGMLLGSAVLAALAFSFERPTDMTWTVRGVLALGYLALLGTTMTFGIYFWLLRTTPASRLSLITYVTPVIAMLLGSATGDGVMDGFAWGGTALVVSGIVLVVTRR
ncbi:MAG: EamA family transporter [Planctomycetes bacterium]|nr:EamA family transporter [Planctomycetota bacterium]